MNPYDKIVKKFVLRKDAVSMGMFLNRGTKEFERSVNSAVYVDKTDMISFFNGIINTEQSYVCVSRPRRFGKTMTANMLAAYYEKGSDSRFLFEERKLGKQEGWDRYINKFDVLRIDIADILSTYGDPDKAMNAIEAGIVSDIMKAYPELGIKPYDRPANALDTASCDGGNPFVIIIDEWDAFFREQKSNEQLLKRYVDFLRALFKGNRSKVFTAFAYITGILPIKRYNSESALNNFAEYTMLNPLNLGRYFGFNSDEVKNLCLRYGMNYDRMCDWYDGYCFADEDEDDDNCEIVEDKADTGEDEDKTADEHIFGPNSVAMAVFNHKCLNYWSKTVAFDSLASYITMNFDKLRDSIVELMGGGRMKVKTGGFQNDMTSFKSKDDVMTVLIHLGYLAYDSRTEEVYIPNKEVMQCFEQTLQATDWTEVIEAIDDSEKLLKNLIGGNAEAVAEGIEKCHRQNSSILKYNDENSLASIIGLAFYAARAKYQLIREFPSGEGFADIVFLPKKGIAPAETPAIVVELKWMKSAESALDQIKAKKYPEGLEGFSNEIILCGISYDKDGDTGKHHTCVIEKIRN